VEVLRAMAYVCPRGYISATADEVICILLRSQIYVLLRWHLKFSVVFRLIGSINNNIV
jgi:hypothetical protein